MTVLLSIAYDGRSFAGFAPQPGQRTIAGELLGAIREMDPTVREVRGASRTDAGVHARDQRVAFDPKAAIPPRGWALGLGRHLPQEIAVRRAAVAPEGFTPRFASAGKRYVYELRGDPLRDPFSDGRAWRLPDAIVDTALEAMRAEAQSALGEHDFAAFRSAADERERTVRTIRRFDVARHQIDRAVVLLTVEGDAFMHNMVRILVGTLVDVARGRKPAGAVARALASRDRRDAGITAPPDGLYLDRVFLTEDGADPWPPDGDPAAEIVPR